MSLERPPHTPDPPAIRFTEVSRHFGEVRAVDRVSFDILDGELFTLLGPSGSGKTTCLRLIGGFEHPTSGSIQLHGVEAAALPPWARDVNTVFQDYALFPHMTVVENVEYGLKIKKVEKKARRRRAEESLELVRLPGLGDRRPAELSGGQRQRVALARALVNRPRALLLDEPLGALDLKLRHEMQVELKALQAQVGITFVLVTHDQEEALSMSDRIAVFHRGRIEQIGTPHEVYEQPATAFVASFVGFTNLLSGTAAAALRGTSEPFSVRPEKLLLVDPVTPVGDDHLAADGVITASVYLGAHTRFVVTLERAKREDGSPVTLTVLEQNHDRPGHGPRARGQRVRVTWPKGQVQTLSAPAAESLGPAESLR